MNILLRALLVDAMVSTIGHSKPVKDSADAFGYLEQFGYLDGTKNANTAADLDPNAFKKAIKDFQVRKNRIALFQKSLLTTGLPHLLPRRHRRILIVSIVN